MGITNPEFFEEITFLYGGESGNRLAEYFNRFYIIDSGNLYFVLRGIILTEVSAGSPADLKLNVMNPPWVTEGFFSTLKV